MAGWGSIHSKSKAYKTREGGILGIGGIDVEVVETLGAFYGDGDSKEESIAAILGASRALEGAAEGGALGVSSIKRYVEIMDADINALPNTRTKRALRKAMLR